MSLKASPLGKPANGGGTKPKIRPPSVKDEP